MATRAQGMPIGGRDKATAARRRKSAAGRKSGGGWLCFWPLALGLAATPLAVRYAEVLPLLGAPGLARLRLLFPFAMFAHQPQLGLPDATAELIAQVLIYAQFPLYGLLTSILLLRSPQRWPGLVRGVLTMVALHAVAAGAVWLMAQM